LFPLFRTRSACCATTDSTVRRSEAAYPVRLLRQSRGGGGGTRRRDKFCPVEALVYGALGAVKGCERTRAAGGCDAHFGLGGDGARRACTAVLHDPGSCSRRPAQGVSHHPCTPSLCRHDEARTQDDGETASVAGTGVVELITKWVRHPNPTVLPPHATRAPLVGAYGAVRRCAGFAWR
jgi:hypothetical protein